LILLEHYEKQQTTILLNNTHYSKICPMENLIVSLLTDEALEELKEMERNKKIHILNKEDIANLKTRKKEMLNEVDNYTYDSILRSLKKLDSE
jgi:hypothetical protein